MFKNVQMMSVINIYISFLTRGGHLAHIENAEQQQKIYDVARQYHRDHAWIGLNDRASEEHFVWSSGKSLCLPSFEQ